MSGSRVRRWRGDGWEGVEPRAYKEDDGRHRGVARHPLAGGTREGGRAGEADPGSLPFEVRAFRVEAGGFTSRERHAHPHSVVVLTGRGSVLLGAGEEERSVALAPLDAVEVAPWEPHQFRADAGEPLLFLCVVPAERDRPRPVDGDGGGADAPSDPAPPSP